MRAPSHVEESTVHGTAQGRHGVCWRAECRRANHPYGTVSYRRGCVVVAFCHGREYRTLFDLVAELWAHAG
jgi:hypothetical protein